MQIGPWTCDMCGQSIERAEDGWIEWLSTGGPGDGKTFHTLILVHRAGRGPNYPRSDCQHKTTGPRAVAGNVLSVAQTDFMGSDGLVTLLSMLAEDRFEDNVELHTMIQRLHVPGYERAHKHFKAAISQGVFEPNTFPGFYQQADIKLVNEWLDERNG